MTNLNRSSNQSIALRKHNDLYFVRPMLSATTGVSIGLIIGHFLGWC